MAVSGTEDLVGDEAEASAEVGIGSVAFAFAVAIARGGSRFGAGFQSGAFDDSVHEIEKGADADGVE